MNPSNRWSYGSSWEKFPIEPGEIWRAGTGLVSVHNIFDPLPSLMADIDLLFIDPPWGLGNLNSYYTKAGRTDYVGDFSIFILALFGCIDAISPRTCYIEIGKENVDVFRSHLQERFGFVSCWPSVYYRKYPCFILRGGDAPYAGKDLSGMDETDCIKHIAETAKYKVIGDLCMGRGLVGLHAFKAGRAFRGTELNKRRLAVLLEGISKAGGEVKRVA